MLEQLLPHVLPVVSEGHELPEFESGERRDRGGGRAE